jgi:hypothetical protein
MGRGCNEKWKETMQAPIKITLYGAGEEPKQEYTCAIIPWGVLKKAIALTKSIDQNDVGEEDMDAIAALVVQAFGNQFTVQDVDAGADIGEMLAVMQSIVARASNLVQANPTPLPTAKKRSK